MDVHNSSWIRIKKREGISFLARRAAQFQREAGGTFSFSGRGRIKVHVVSLCEESGMELPEERRIRPVTLVPAYPE